MSDMHIDNTTKYGSIVNMNADEQLRYQWSRRKPHSENIPQARRSYIKSNSNASQQRCTVKVGIEKPDKLKGKIDYITRKDAFNNEEDRKLFTAPDRELNTEPIKDEKRYFHMIISPENADKLDDFQKTVQRTMERVEKSSGYKLQWCAAVHDNCEHKHAHVIVRGVDLDGREVRFDREFIKSEIRNLAQKQVTNEIGQRTRSDKLQSAKNEIDKERVTSLDRRLDQFLNKNNVVKKSASIKIDEKNVNVKLDPMLIRRLAHLEKLGVARRTGGSYQLSENWKDKLREKQIDKDIMKRIHRVKSVDQKNATYFKHDGQHNFKGQIVDKGIDNEVTGKPYLVIKEHGTNNLVHMTDEHFKRGNVQYQEQSYRIGENVNIQGNNISRDREMNREQKKSERGGQGR